MLRALSIFYDLLRRKSSQLVFVRVDPMIFIGGRGCYKHLAFFMICWKGNQISWYFSGWIQCYLWGVILIGTQHFND